MVSYAKFRTMRIKKPFNSILEPVECVRDAWYVAKKFLPHARIERLAETKPNKTNKEPIDPKIEEPTLANSYFKIAHQNLRILRERSKCSNWLPNYFRGDQRENITTIDSSILAMQQAEAELQIKQNTIEKMEQKLKISYISVVTLSLSLTLLLSYLYSLNSH